MFMLKSIGTRVLLAVAPVIGFTTGEPSAPSGFGIYGWVFGVLAVAADAVVVAFLLWPMLRRSPVRAD